MGCTSANELDSAHDRLRNQKGEYIYRKHDEIFLLVPPPERQIAQTYPWEKEGTSRHPRITKEFFRCKGSSLNPCHIVQKQEEPQRYHDCGGAEKHSLPLRDGKEFVYPILLELANYIQDETNKRLVITSGHRCPEHNAYVDPSSSNQYSKHAIGAEVAFYIQGMEERPEAIVKLIQDFYKKDSRYKGKREYEEFKRYEKSDVNVSTAPWMNKEIFIKLFKKDEGRNFDNRHPYPYISIQVRYDRDLKERVVYTWGKAHNNYHRW